MLKPTDPSLDHARRLAAIGDDDAAKAAFLRLLHADPACFEALNGLAWLANASGHRSAARTAWQHAVRCHPGNPAGQVNLGNLLLEDDDPDAAIAHFQAALAADPECPQAHQGMARALAERGDIAADMHWRRGFAGNAVVRKPYRGFGAGVPVVVLVSALGGNVPTKGWLDDRRHDVTAIYAEYFDDEQDLPPHALMVNAIGDADLCGDALTRAARIVALARAPVINPPALVARTGRAENAARLAGVPGVVAPAIRATSKGELLAARWVRFPLLVRVPGRHTGRHFVMARDRAELEAGVAELPGDALLAIDYLDARGADGLARKYRVMFVDGRMYPLHLALSRDWKVHYFSADMAACATHRAEEAAFLADMAGVLGPVAMAALHGIGTALGLEYAGVDFALAPDGRVMLFEANATMVVNPPDKGPMWDYRRPAVAAVLDAVTWMLQRRVA